MQFGPDSDYETEFGSSIPKEKMPIQGPWRPGHLKAFVTNFEENEDITGSKEGPNVNMRFPTFSLIISIFSFLAHYAFGLCNVSH